MPPELLSEGRLSKAADVYSFGVMLWEMCAFIFIISSLLPSVQWSRDINMANIGGHALRPGGRCTCMCRG
jgi:serine/threonine protein kinase